LRELEREGVRRGEKNLESKKRVEIQGIGAKVKHKLGL